MNTRLAEFLISLVRDPKRLSTFNDPDYGREAVLRDADLPEEDKEALRSEDAAEVLRRLQATDEDGLSWVLAPGVKKFTVGVTLSGSKALDASDAMAMNAPGVKAMNAPGVKAMNESDVKAMNAPGVKAMNAPGVKAMNAPGVKAMNAPGVKAISAPRAGAAGSKKPGGGRPAKRARARSSAARGSTSKSRR